jgi:hypothetical protein
MQAGKYLYQSLFPEVYRIYDAILKGEADHQIYCALNGRSARLRSAQLRKRIPA